MSNPEEHADEVDFDTLALLPGGALNYVGLIVEVLGDLSNRSNPTVIDVERALSKDRVIALRSMDNYVQLLQRMSLLVRHHDDRITLKPLARHLLAATPDEQIRLLADMLLSHCKAMADVLGVYVNAVRPLMLKEVHAALNSRFPNWGTPTSYKQRNLWLRALHCLVKDGPRHLSATDFGRTMLQQHKPRLDRLITEIETETEIDDLDATSSVDESEDLIDELQAASIDSGNHRRLEEAAAAALAFLDLRVELKGNPGQPVPDGVASSTLPARPYRLVMDTKSRADGHLTGLEVMTLSEYRSQEKADHAVVVAGSFADGKMVRHAQEQHVTLLTVEALSDLIRLHAITPLSLADYEVIFATPGIVDALPEGILKAADQQRRWAELVALLIFNLQDVYRNGLDEPLSAAQIDMLLFSRLNRKRFTLAEINAALEFLCSPLIACLQRDSTGAVTLCMNHATFMRRLRTLTDRFESYYEVLAQGKAVTDQNNE